MIYFSFPRAVFIDLEPSVIGNQIKAKSLSLNNILESLSQKESLMTSWHIFGLWLLLLKKELQFRVWPGFLLRPPLIRWSSSGDLPGLVSPPAINQRKGGCGQQLRTRSLHYWQRNHRSHYWSDQKNGRSLHWIARLFGLSFLWWRDGNKKPLKNFEFFFQNEFFIGFGICGIAVGKTQYWVYQEIQVGIFHLSCTSCNIQSQCLKNETFLTIFKHCDFSILLYSIHVPIFFLGINSYSGALQRR